MAHGSPRSPRDRGHARAGRREHPRRWVDVPDRPRLNRRNAMTSEHYDVIIIGTGAGGGTLAHRLAPTGKRILLLERGGYLPREPENWDIRGGLPQGALPDRRALVRQGRRRLPARTSSTSSAATRSSTARSSSACASATSARSATTAASRRRGRSPTTTSSPTTPRPSGSTSSTARRGEDPTEPPALGPVPVPRRLARAAHPAARTTTSCGPATTRSTCPVGVDLDESDPEAGPLRALRPLRRLPLPDRRQGRRARPLRAPRARARQRHAAHAREGGAAGDRRRRALGHRGRRRPPRRARRATAPTSSSSPAARSTRRRCCCARPATGIRNGLANSSDVVGRHYMAHINSGVIAISQTPNTTKFQKTLGVNDYYWGAEDSELPLGHIQMLGKSDRDILRAGAPWFAPGLALDYIARHAIDFWLTTEDLPAPGQPRDGRPPGPHPPRQDLPQPRAPQAAAGQAQGPARARSAATTPPIPRWSILDQRIPLAGVAHQCGTVRFGTDPERRRRSTSTARPTTSTTCTSSTRASSRRRAR